MKLAVIHSNSDFYKNYAFQGFQLFNIQRNVQIHDGKRCRCIAF